MQVISSAEKQPPSQHMAALLCQLQCFCGRRPPVVSPAVPAAQQQPTQRAWWKETFCWCNHFKYHLLSKSLPMTSALIPTELKHRHLFGTSPASPVRSTPPSTAGSAAEPSLRPIWPRDPQQRRALEAEAAGVGGPPCLIGSQRCLGFGFGFLRQISI